MSLQNKPLSALTEDDLLSLIANKVAEGKEHEYKRDLIGNSDADRKEFLNDVSSFANTVGGHLFYGIDEADGIPTNLCGLQDVNLDKTILRLESSLQAGIAPRIAGIGIQPITVSTGTVIVLRIPRSWSAPHMVTLLGHGKFYARNSAGKYQLDVFELRNAFTATETAFDRIRQFRLDRIGRILAEDTPTKLREGAKLVLHVIPLNAFDSSSRIDQSILVKAGHEVHRFQEKTFVTKYRHNLDGILLYETAPHVLDCTYIQFFRNGAIELADTYIFNGLDGKEYTIPSRYEEYLLEILSILFTDLQELEVKPPLAILITLMEVKGRSIQLHGQLGTKYVLPASMPLINQSDILLPEIVIEDFGGDIATSLRPVFDMVWNACGFPRSLNFDDAGKWIHPSH